MLQKLKAFDGALINNVITLVKKQTEYLNVVFGGSKYQCDLQSCHRADDGSTWLRGRTGK